MLRPLSLAAVGLALFACSSGETTGTTTDCSKVSNCYDLCVCATGDTVGCGPACATPATGGTGNFGGGGATGGTGAGGTATGGTAGSGGTPSGDFATALSINRIDLQQGVGLPLMKDGVEQPTKAPGIMDREARIRVYVMPDAEYQPREIVARVTLGGSTPGTFDGKGFINGASDEFNQDTTINVDIPAGVLKPDTTYGVTLHEAAPGAVFPGGSGGASWPPGGAQVPMPVKSTNGVFNLIIVPVVINGITPDLNANRIQNYHDRLMKLYPAPEVNIQVRNPANYGGSVSANGSGWNNLLDWLMNLRVQDGVASNHYYYGVVTPTQSMQQYCPGGCVAGLSNLPDGGSSSWDIVARTGSGLGFFPQGGNPESADTMAHEVGHTLGLAHAPCSQFGSISGVDGNYPYQGAVLGTWGWDIYTRQLVDPNKNKDIMAYCDPSWISDYNFNKIFNRMSYANANAEMIVTDPERLPGVFDTAIIDAQGKLSWGITKQMPYPLFAEKKTVELLDDAGNVVGKVTGFHYPLAHGGSFLYVRKQVVADHPAASFIKPAGSAAQLALP